MTLGSIGTVRALRAKWSATVDEYVTALAVRPDGARVAVGTGVGDVCVFDVASGSLRFRRNSHPGGVFAMEWSPDGHALATGGHGPWVRLQDEDGNELAELAAPAWVEHVAWSPDGRRLAGALGKVVRVWSEASVVSLDTEEHESTVTGIAWNRRGTELATACSGGVRIFRVGSSVPARRLRFDGSLVSLTWSPDDAIIACGTEGNTVHFWRLATMRDAEMAGFRAKPRALAWDVQSRLLATSGGDKVAVWKFDEDGPEGRRPLLLSGHEALCTVVAFHPDGRWLASGSDDSQVMIWDTSMQTTPLAVGALEDTVTGAAWALGGRALVGVDARGMVRTWASDLKNE